MKRKATPEQQAERHARLQMAMAKFTALTDDQRQEIVARVGFLPTIEGHPLSPHNTCLLITQLETATIVGGFRQWRARGRHVRKGERGLIIWIPKGIKDEGQSTRDQQAYDSSQADNKPGFVAGYVFDISQTDESEADA